MNRTTRLAHLASVALMGVLVLGATGVGFAQSWAGLYGWAVEHGLHGWKAASFPAMVDAFIGVGELGLFALTLEGHRLTRRVLSWLDLVLPGAIAAAGWCVSLAFNVGHVRHDLAVQLTAAVPPVAAMLGLLVLLRTLHRLVTQPSEEVLATTEAAGHDEDEPLGDDPSVTAARERFCDVLSMGAVPSIRAIRRELRVGHPRAVNIRKALEVESGQQAPAEAHDMGPVPS